jgi:hypothetical protein
MNDCAHMDGRLRIALAGVLAMLVGVIGAGGCRSGRPAFDPASPEISAYMQLVLPERIEIQKSWTRPLSFAGDGSADGLEVLVAAYDAAGEKTKAVGEFLFELSHVRRASADRVGPQVCVWTVALDSSDAMTQHWDPLSRFYRFQLLLDDRAPLAPDKYLLSARLQPPGNASRLFAEYEFTHAAGAVPSARPN